MAFQQANYFVLASDKYGGVAVTYTEANIAGQPVVTHNEQTFTGEQVKRQSSPLGELVTVTLEQLPDLRTVTFTLTVPVVNLETGLPAKVSLLGITATTHTTIAGPPAGQTQTYESVDLEGEGSHIVS